MLVSVVIPCYNVANYLEDCLNSVWNQSYSRIEVICIDNNSTDNTWKVLERLKVEYPSLILEKELEKGAPAARNKGIKISSGTWLQFLDADDLLMPTKIENQINAILENPETSVVIGNYKKRDIDGREKEGTVNLDIWKGLFSTQLGITSSNLYKKSAVNTVNNWDTKYDSSQESKLLFEILKNNEKLTYSMKVETIVRERSGGQISTTNLDKRWTTYINLRLDIYTFLKECKESYFKANIEYFNSKLFLYFQILSKYDSSKASELYKKSFVKGYLPNDLKMSLRMSYKILGFGLTNKLINIYRS